MVVVATAISMPGLESAPEEQRMLFYDVSWKEYMIFRELFARPSLRMTYLQGALELLSPSAEHELWKKNIARFIELYAFLKNIELYGYGSTTFKKEAKTRGAEPDECYLVGKKLDDFPEIVLEVIHTAPLLDKLDVYAGMGVSEVWISTSRWRSLCRSSRYAASATRVRVRHPGLNSRGRACATNPQPRRQAADFRSPLPSSHRRGHDGAHR